MQISAEKAGEKAKAKVVTTPDETLHSYHDTVANAEAFAGFRNDEAKKMGLMSRYVVEVL